VLNGGKAPTVSTDHPNVDIGNRLLMEALGTVDADFANGLIQQLVNASSQGKQINEDDLNFMLSIIKGIKPRDQLEAMLAAHMAATHNLIMTFARRLARVQTIQELDSIERALNKLARTFTTQIETFKRYRTGGEQKVTVHQVSVSEGGQAIVGNVTQAAREAAPAATSPPALTDARMAPMAIAREPEREPVPIKRKSNT
jgi:hypothetical protein